MMGRILPFLAALPVAAWAAETPSASIVHVALGPEAEEVRPVAVPTEPENTVELDLPAPLEDWAGRGFTPDPERFAGDFVIEAARGNSRCFITPVTAGAHRVLHVVVGSAETPARSIAVEFMPAPSALAWTKVVFDLPRPATAGFPAVTLSPRPPRTRLRDPSPESEIGLLRTLRLLLDAPAEGAAAVAAANPALAIAPLDGMPRSFGDFTLTPRFAVRDATTGAIGLCASVANQTSRRLLFDPAAWVLRAGDRVYPVGTVDFPPALEPAATAAAFLVVAFGPNGEPLRLLPSNHWEVSASLLASADPRPVRRMRIEGLDSP
jgi:hypothetical protein